MSAVEPGSATTGLIDRVKAILLKPAPTWEVIDKEPATVSGLYKGYIIPLAAIAPVAGLIGGSVVGVAGFHQPLLGGIVEAVVSYILALVMVYVLALVIEALAPSFDGQKDRMQALKVATYASTAAWIAAPEERPTSSPSRCAVSRATRTAVSASTSQVPFDPSVQTSSDTSHPASAQRASVAPAPNSMSSGCAPTASARSGTARSRVRTITGRRRPRRRRRERGPRE